MNLVEFAAHLVSTLWYPWVFAGTFFESLFPPIPSEIVMALSGFLIAQGRFEFAPVLLCALAGNVTSVSIFWFLWHKYGKPFLIRYGRFVWVSERDIERGEKLFETYGYLIIFFAQMFPIARTLVAFPAGILRVRFWLFIIANTLGAAIWFTLLTSIGMTLGTHWQDILTYTKPYETVMTVIFGIAGIVFLWHTIRSYKKNIK